MVFLGGRSLGLADFGDGVELLFRSDMLYIYVLNQLSLLARLCYVMFTGSSALLPIIYCGMKRLMMKELLATTSPFSFGVT